MRVTLTLGGNAATSLRQEADTLIAAAADGVADATASLEQTLRRQVVAAGLGSRLANTWRSQVFPPTVTKAAGEVWTVAPLIIEGFDEGPTIIARNGSRWLAIPTANVPPRSWGAKAPGGHPRRLMTPVEVEAAFNRDLRMVQPPGSSVAYLIMDQLVTARSGRGFRQATSRRLAQGRSVQPVLMFVLVPQVTLSKRLDIAGAVAAVPPAVPTPGCPSSVATSAPSSRWKPTTFSASGAIRPNPRAASSPTRATSWSRSTCATSACG